MNGLALFQPLWENCSMLDITGKKFFRLTAIKFSHRDKSGNHYWLFKCKCGNEKLISKSCAISGHSKSCGCLHKELVVQKNKILKTTHGMRYTPFYSIWRSMHSRVKHDKNYSSRGILICKRWNKFENFYKDMFLTYKKGLTLERKNNEGHYNPKNCKWATTAEQNRNKRNTLQYKGECAKDASFRLGGASTLVFDRIKNGWSKKKAFSRCLEL